MYLKISILLFFIGLGAILNAQNTDCMNTLKEAREHYDQGLIDEIPNLLSGCMESGFTRAQKIEAYKLLILAYLFDDDQYEAEKTMDEFLKKFPEYEIMPNDPTEFVFLLESYKTASSYSINVFFGPNFSNARIIEPYTLLDQSQTITEDKTDMGYQFGFGVSRNIWKSMFINVDVIYSSQNYQFIQEGNTLIDDQAYTYVNIKAKESLQQINIPLTFTYNFGKGNTNYFVRLGGNLGLVNKTTITPSTEIGGNFMSENPIPIESNRMKNNYAIVAGFGIQYKIPRGFLVIDARYHQGINNRVIADKRYDNPLLISKYYYVDSDFSVNALYINFGYYLSIYKSKKNRL